LKSEIEKKINSTKGLKKKKNQIEKKKYIANWDGRMKLKINKTSIRGSRKKNSKSKE
jgi:hypothetical protein